MKPTLLVLAAGMGSRYGGLKQLDPMGPNGEVVLDYSVYDAIRAGFGKVVFIIRRDFEQIFKEQVGSRFADKIKVDYAFQSLDDLPAGFSVPEGREKPWGTAHALRAARDVVNEPFAVVNADDFYGPDSFVQAAKFLSTAKDCPNKAHYGMVGYPLKNTLSENGDVNRGICTIKDNLLVGVEEFVKIQPEEDGVVRGDNLEGKRLPVDPAELVSMNFWLFSPSFIQLTEEHLIDFLKKHGTEPKSECFIPTVVDSLINSNRADCQVLSTSSNWFGVTYPKDKPAVVAGIRALIDSGVYPEKL
ncbi:MAG: sugar phosphate nucleotidyltransferase [Akkermansia sp.]